MKFDTWTTADGGKVKVVDMEDLHLIHLLRAILENRVMSPVPDHSHIQECVDEADPDLAVDHYSEAFKRRMAWLTVLKGEATKRGLDWSVSPTRKVGLVELVLEQMPGLNHREWWIELVPNILAKLGIEQPLVDISTSTGKPTYLHWLAGNGVGTPVKR